MTQKVFFMQQVKTPKTLVKKARNSLYKKDNVFLNIFNKSEKKFFCGAGNFAS